MGLVIAILLSALPSPSSSCTEPQNLPAYVAAGGSRLRAQDALRQAWDHRLRSGCDQGAVRQAQLGHSLPRGQGGTRRPPNRHDSQSPSPKPPLLRSSLRSSLLANGSHVQQAVRVCRGCPQACSAAVRWARRCVRRALRTRSSAGRRATRSSSCTPRSSELGG